jgi:hypothetical protein
MCTTFPVDADTATCLPSGDTAMWSERWPATGKRQAIFPDRMFRPTTSLKLGLEMTSRLPLREVYMSSAN